MTEESNALAIKPDKATPWSLAPRNFQEALQAAEMYSKSKLVPEQYRGDSNGCFVALQLANRQGVDPLMLMQNSYVVHGKPGVEGKYAIALMNARGPFKGGVHFEYFGAGDTRGCTAWGDRRDTGERCSTTVDMKMVKAEKWDSNSKWKSMTDQMLAYRSGAFLARMYCPEVLMGMQTVEEIQDVIEVQGTHVPADPPPVVAPEPTTEGITPKQHALMGVLLKQRGIPLDVLKKEIGDLYGVESRKDLASWQAAEIIGWMETWKAPPAPKEDIPFGAGPADTLLANFKADMAASGDLDGWWLDHHALAQSKLSAGDCRVLEAHWKGLSGERAKEAVSE